ncbi:MAG: hypothetical protein ABSC95_12775, partial [Acetobacteraceae bacterium]
MLRATPGLDLNQAEREELTALLSGGKHAVRKLKWAQILLAAAAGVSDEAIGTSVAVGGCMVYRTKRRFVEGNLELAASEEARPGAARRSTARPRRRSLPPPAGGGASGPLSCARCPSARPSRSH